MSVNAPSSPSRIDSSITFLQGFLKKPQVVASIIPSSQFLERRIVQRTYVAEATVVVELGPGTGGTTRAMLKAMRPDAKLIGIEINKDFFKLLSRINDERFIIHNGDARDLVGILKQYDCDSADVVFSGIPFSTMPRAVGIGIIQSVYDSLSPGGRFVAYQFRDRVGELGKTVFGPPRVALELLNVPPARVYCWEKNA